MNILWIKDGKKGHEKQVSVLLEELGKNININIYEEECTLSRFKKALFLIDCFLLKLGSFFKKNNSFITRLSNKQIIKFKEKKINIVIGAGSGPQIQLLIYKQEFDTKIISVLTPAFFKDRYDLICSPIHDSDRYKKSNNVIFFEGSLAKVSDEIPNNDLGFIGIGGKNKHFVFDQKKLYQQIEYIISIYSNIYWEIFPSRRTPIEMVNKLKDLKSKYSNIQISSEDIDVKIKNASIKIVTQDSVNMVFECLSTKGETYLFNMKYYKKTKIVNLMNRLCNNQQIGYIENSQIVDGLNKIKMISRNKHCEVFAEVEKVAYQLQKRISQ
jgi:mitochondrial fission protein ELM1